VAAADASSTANNLPTEISSLSNRLLHGKDEPVNVGVVAERLGVRLTSCERDLLKKKLDLGELHGMNLDWPANVRWMIG